MGPFRVGFVEIAGGVAVKVTPPFELTQVLKSAGGTLG